jgi:hypothetical protein
MSVRARLLAALLGLMLIATACGDDDAEPAPAEEAAGGPGETITVTAIDYAFVGLPAQVKAGTTFTLDNQSSQELHEFVAVRLPDDETRPVAELVQLPMEELEALFPGVATVVIAPPGGDGIPVEGTGTLEEPGRYAVICAIPTGADPAEYMAAAAEAEGGPPEVAGGPPHFVQGMFGEIEVVES